MVKSFNIVSCSPEETESAGYSFAKDLIAFQSGVVALYGDLGAGKTCFVKGIARAFGIEGSVNSPTFSIVNCYYGKYAPLFHIDAYRLKEASEIITIGFEDYINDGICLVEWPERIEPILPPSSIRIKFTIESETKRNIELKNK